MSASLLGILAAHRILSHPIYHIQSQVRCASLSHSVKKKIIETNTTSKSQDSSTLVLNKTLEYSTSTSKIDSAKLFLFEKCRIGIPSRYTKNELHDASNVLFSNLLQKVQWAELLKYGDLEDNILNWYKIIIMHLWMMDVRLLRDGVDGRILHRQMVIGVYKDMHNRLRQMRMENLVFGVNKTVQKFIQESKISTVFYECGIVNDVKLAEALWINLYGGVQGEKSNPVALENWINYIRFTMNYLEDQPMEKFINNPEDIEWEIPPGMAKLN